MWQIVKDNFIYIILVIIALLASIYVIRPEATNAYNKFNQANEAKKLLESKESDLRTLQAQAEASRGVKTTVKDKKKIYELEGAQFSGEASFAPLFEIVLNIAQTSGIRIRSINYNYQPSDDKIYNAHIAEYNVCELSIIAVGSYAQLQNFFRGLMKDPNLSYLAEIEMQPWEKDKKILVANVKVRLYTKTPRAPTSVQLPAQNAAPMAPDMPEPAMP